MASTNPSSSSAPTPPSPPPTTIPTTEPYPSPAQQLEQYQKVKNNLAWGLLLVCPALIAMPPRKLDFYTFTLGGAWVLSANHLTTEKTGRSIAEHMFFKKGWKKEVEGAGEGSGRSELPTERARMVQEQLRWERERRERDLGLLKGHEDKKGLLEKVWMGDEKEGWKERRLREEQEALEQGKSYQDLIWEQVMEVWSRGKKDEGEKKE